MKVLVVGATGTLGNAVTNLLKEKGHEVTGVSRSSQPSLNIDDPSSIDSFYEGLDEVDAIITAAGNAAFKSLEQLNNDDVKLSTTSKLSGQVNMVLKGLKKLRPNGVFIITGGTLAYTPWPQTSLITMVNIGLEGFVRGAALELTEGRRIVVVHPPFVVETAEMLGMDSSPYPTASEAAEAYLEALEGSMTGAPVFVKGHEPK